jgi:hypothetical protein
MRRRHFIALVGGAAASVGVRNILLARDQTLPSDALEGRLADIIAAYDSQGNHRTATSADDASAAWLAKQVRQAGAEPSLEPFTLSRIDPLSCYVRIADRRIDGVPLFDASFTGAHGVRGTLGPIGSDAEIGLAETEPSRLTQPGSEVRRARLAEVRQARHSAVILITRGIRPGVVPAQRAGL